MDDDLIETVHAQAATVPEVDVRDFAFEPVESVTAVDETTNGSAENTLELPASESVNFEETLPVLDFRPADVPDRTPVTYDDHETPPPAEVQEGEDVFGEKEFGVDSVPEVVTDEFRDERESPPEFDEMNLLELPATDTNKQESRGFDEDIVTFDEAPRTDGLTPEFIDEVARKVIERISDNVIRQIAWQVVPQIVESVLREKTKKESEH
jgi:hypothetical protein